MKPLGRSFCVFGLAVLTALLSPVSLRAQEPSPPPPHRPGYVLVDDMWLPETVFTSDGTFDSNPWPNGNMYVAFDPAISNTNRTFFRKVMAEFRAVANIDFFEVAPGFSGDYVLIVPNTGYPSVSHSDIGRQGGEQILAVGSNHWDDKYIIAHEVMHAFGFLHEQSRPDRNSYVTINYNNISQSACNGSSCDHNFDIVSGSTTTGAYDFNSIMHYSSTSFSVNGQPTISAKPAYAGSEALMGNRQHFSVRDAQALQAYYGQPGHPTITYVTPSAVEATTVSQLTIDVGGIYYFEGSLDGEGVLGTRIRFNGTELDTTWLNATTCRAVVPGNLLQVAGTYPVDVINDSHAGGASTTTVNFTVLPPPCTSQSDQVGYSVTGLGDINGDGKADYAVGIPGYNGNAGRVRVYSGAAGTILWSASGSAGSRFGTSIASIGDVNGDGKQDLLIGAPNYNSDAGRFEIRSGANGAVLAVVNGGTTGSRFGWSVSGIGDIDGDGDQDFIIGAPGYNNSAGRIEVWSANGGLMRALNGAVAGDAFGASVGGGYDLNFDGVPDYIIGAPEKTVSGSSSVGAAYVYSGATGALLVTKFGDAQYDKFGSAVAIIPTTDVSGPYGQILVGAPEVGNIFSGTGNGAGYVRLFQHASLLASYTTIATLTGTTVGDRFGWSVSSAGDIDDDGYNDFIVGYPQSSFLAAPVGPGGCVTYSGQARTVLHRFQGNPGDELWGFAVADLGDVDGDARLDIIVGGPGADTGCIDAGSFLVIHPPVPPEHQKVMITEVSTGNPDCVEITNFGTAAVNLSNWVVKWKDGATLTSGPLNVTIQAGEIIVVKEPGGTLLETPANIQVLSVLPSIGTTTGDCAIALVNDAGVTIDEVHLGDANGAYAEGSLGGKFRGLVTQTLTGPGEVNAERIWGLDSNGGRDWTTGRVRSMGLENVASGFRGSDPAPQFTVRINEVDDSPDLIELHRPGSILLSPAVQLQGWYILASGAQNLAHSEIKPFPNSFTLAAGGYCVIGEGATAPAEKPAAIPYINLTAIGGGNIPWTTAEFDCALYDSYGRLVDYLRATKSTGNVAHNHPRAPSHWSDFTGAAFRLAGGDGAVGRNEAGADNNAGRNFAPISNRTMGSYNAGMVFSSSPDASLDARLNPTGIGGGLTIILNAGVDHAGEKWTYAFSGGHLNGTGPILGLGADAVNNWLFTATTLPFYGFLDSFGSARLDIPSNSLPPGIQTDGRFFLQQNNGDVFAPFILISQILEFDT